MWFHAHADILQQLPCLSTIILTSHTVLAKVLTALFFEFSLEFTQGTACLTNILKVSAEKLPSKSPEYAGHGHSYGAGHFLS